MYYSMDDTGPLAFALGRLCCTLRVPVTISMPGEIEKKMRSDAHLLNSFSLYRVEQVWNLREQ
jgi:hypothetical protein